MPEPQRYLPGRLFQIFPLSLHIHWNRRIISSRSDTDKAKPQKEQGLEQWRKPFIVTQNPTKRRRRNWNVQLLSFTGFLNYWKIIRYWKSVRIHIFVLMSLSKALNATAIYKSVKKFEKITGVNSQVKSCIRLLILACSPTFTTSIIVTGYTFRSAQIFLVPDESIGRHIGYIKWQRDQNNAARSRETLCIPFW